MDVTTLARLEHQNMVETGYSFCSHAPDALVQRVDGVALIVTGLPPRLFNQVVLVDDDAPPAAVEAAAATARARADRFVINLRIGTDDRLVPMMDRLGLVPLSAEPWMPGMALHPVPRAGGTPPPPGHEIRRVTDASGLSDHVRTCADGFGMPREWLAAVMPEALLGQRGVAVYVGYTDGEPVSAGLGSVTGRTIGVYNIATLEAARRRGCGAAMTMRIVDDGAAEGCDVSILQASDMGKPTYERLGFRTVVEYMGYVDPETLPPPDAA